MKKVPYNSMADAGYWFNCRHCIIWTFSTQTDSFLTVDAANLCEFHKWPTVQLSISPVA